MNKELSGKRTFATVMFALCAVVLFTVAMLISGMRQMVSKDGIQKAVDKSEITNVEMPEDITDLVFSNMPDKGESYKKILSPTWVILFTVMGLASIFFIYLVSKKRFFYTITVAGVVSLIFATLSFMVCSSLMNLKIEGNEELGKVFLELVTDKIKFGAAIGVFLGIAEIIFSYVMVNKVTKTVIDES